VTRPVATLCQLSWLQACLLIGNSPYEKFRKGGQSVQRSVYRSALIYIILTQPTPFQAIYTGLYAACVFAASYSRMVKLITNTFTPRDVNQFHAYRLFVCGTLKIAATKARAMPCVVHCFASPMVQKFRSGRTTSCHIAVSFARRCDVGGSPAIRLSELSFASLWFWPCLAIGRTAILLSSSYHPRCMCLMAVESGISTTRFFDNA